MFQMMVVDLIFKDVPVTLKEMESTNCKLPDRLETLQVKWREQKAATKDWNTYFRNIGVPAPVFQSETAWIESCVSRAMSKGPKYGGGKGEGSKGDGSKGDGLRTWTFIKDLQDKIEANRAELEERLTASEKNMQTLHNLI